MFGKEKEFYSKFNLCLGTHHKNKRKLIQPLFNQKALETYSHKFYKHALNLVESLKKHVDGPAFDILVPLHDSIFVGAMGKS